MALPGAGETSSWIIFDRAGKFRSTLPTETPFRYSGTPKMESSKMLKGGVDKEKNGLKRGVVRSEKPINQAFRSFFGCNFLKTGKMPVFQGVSIVPPWLPVPHRPGRSA